MIKTDYNGPVYKSHLLQTKSISYHGLDQIWFCKWYPNFGPFIAHRTRPNAWLYKICIYRILCLSHVNKLLQSISCLTKWFIDGSNPPIYSIDLFVLLHQSLDCFICGSVDWCDVSLFSNINQSNDWSIYLSINWLVNQPIDCLLIDLFNRLIGWLFIDWFIGTVISSSYCLTGFVIWLTDRSIDRSRNCLIYWLIDWLIHWLMDWLIFCIIEWLACWLTGKLIDWLIDWPIDRSINRLIDWMNVQSKKSNLK